MRARCEDSAAPGQTLEVAVVKAGADRFTASIKHLEPDPWQAPDLAPGREVDGTVGSTPSWGTLIDLDIGLIGWLEPSARAAPRGVRGRFEITAVDRVERRLRVRWVVAAQ